MSVPFTPVRLSAQERAAETRALESLFPGFEILERAGVMPYHVVRGPLRPFHSYEQAGVVAANMRARVQLSTDYDGLLYPGDETLAPLRIRRRARLLDPQTVEVVLVAAPDAHQVFLVEPVVDAHGFPWLTHLYHRPHPAHADDPRLPKNEACILAHSDGTWDRSRPVAELLNHVAAWLGAFRLRAYGGLDGWPLPEAPHSAEGWLTSTSPTAPCYCGRGATYSKCHRPQDLRVVRSRFSERYASMARLRNVSRRKGPFRA